MHRALPDRPGGGLRAPHGLPARRGAPRAPFRQAVLLREVLPRAPESLQAALRPEPLQETDVPLGPQPAALRVWEPQ